MQRRELLAGLGAALLAAAVPAAALADDGGSTDEVALPYTLPDGLVPPGELTVLGPDASLVILRCPNLTGGMAQTLCSTLGAALPEAWRGRFLVMCGPAAATPIEALDETAMRHAGWVRAETKHHV